MARALWAGPQARTSLRARATHALGHEPAWLTLLLDELQPVSEATWQRQSVEDLADRLERTDTFADAVRTTPRPFVRRWILRASRMHPAPLGLEGLGLPPLPHSAAIAAWLGITLDDLDWFTHDRRHLLPLQSQHYGFTLQPKRSGGGRVIESPRSRLKALQGRVLHDLLDKVPVHEACHGFVTGRSVLTHARLHTGQPVVMHFDLKNFFGRILSSQVAAVFHTLGYPRGVARQLAALCTVSTPEPVIERLRDDGWVDWQDARALRRAHVPQGAPSSPMLANLCAFQLDLRLDGLAHVLGATYSRYADDLVLSGPASLRSAFERIATWVGRIALEEGYALNHRKTRLATQASAQRVCGVVVNEHLNLPRAEFDRLRAVLHQCALHGPASQNRDGHADFRAHLWGRVQWATQLNPAKAERLQARWQRIDWAP
ncbi:reverse transcriptase family protein [Rhizobacter sp. OV335]|uniref:reverse transcriptase family protein n=1 Tax=Rhizobacter sp. OV335 TaxID=1500264 RepID=UPI0013565078|nr:reverse transcriptase family protein [Rhizobacter sp. OV335]